MVFFVKMLPRLPLPLMIISEKSTSHLNFLSFEFCRKFIVTLSASPLGFAEKYFTVLDFFDDDRLYILSRVTPDTANLLI